METYVFCSSCNHKIFSDDINISTNIALCRQCGKVHPYTILSTNTYVKPYSNSVINDNEYITINHIDHKTIITYKKKSLFYIFAILMSILFFYGFFSCFTSQLEEHLFILLDSLWGCACLMVALTYANAVLSSLYGKLVITLNNGHGEIFDGYFRCGSYQYFKYNKETNIGFHSVWKKDSEDNYYTAICIIIKTDHKEITFADALGLDDKEYLAVLLTNSIYPNYHC